MELNREEKLMEAVELSEEHREFQRSATALAKRIRSESERLGYNLESALTLVENGNLTVHCIDERGGMEGFTGLPTSVGLFLTGNACGGLFPQAPETEPKASLP